MSAKGWAACLLIAGLIIAIGSLTYVLRSKKKGDAFDNQLSGSFLAMAFGGLLAAIGAAIFICLGLSRYLSLIHLIR